MEPLRFLSLPLDSPYLLLYYVDDARSTVGYHVGQNVMPFQSGSRSTAKAKRRHAERRHTLKAKADAGISEKNRDLTELHVIQQAIHTKEDS
jgi:pyridoxal biosynthesis lyase PdxS